MGCKYVKEFDFDSSSGYSGSAGKTMVRGYARGGSACGGDTAMKKGGKSKPTKPSAKKSSAKASRSSKKDKRMAEAVLAQMLAQADDTGRMPGVPVTQGRPMPAPGARAVPVAPQAPLVAMKSGGSGAARK